jgi:PAS domain S-box-containing protein
MGAAATRELDSREVIAPIGLGALIEAAPLFESLPSTPFFVKDDALRFVSVNAAMAELCGASSCEEVVGRSARDFFPEHVCSRHEALERRVMRTGKPLRDQLDLCWRKDETARWLLVGRWPVVGSSGESIGVAGIARALDTKRRLPIYQRLSAAIDYLHANFGARLDIADVASKVGVSPDQLKRDFVSVFGVPPRRYLSMIRLHAALEMLASGLSIAEVAHACGYPDQSSFTHRFRDAVGASPSEYRRRLLSTHEQATETKIAARA